MDDPNLKESINDVCHRNPTISLKGRGILYMEYVMKNWNLELKRISCKISTMGCTNLSAFNVGG